MALAYLLNPCDQYQNRAGVNNVAGYFEVFLADTDDRATVYVDFEGTLAPARIPIDMNGRCVMVVDAAPAYRVEMHDRSGNLIFTQSPVNAFGGGAGGGSGKVEVKSSDGSVNVTKTTVGDTTVFDIGLPEDSVDGLAWIRCDGCTVEDGFMRPVYTSGTMAVGGTGVIMGADKYYHVTAHVRATKGSPENIYDRVSVEFVKRSEGTDTVLQSGTRIVDYSFGMVQEFEVSGDFLEHSEFELCVRVTGLDSTGGAFELLDMEAHRVYSGIAQGGSGGGVQANWAEQDPTDPSFIRNKPAQKPVYAEEGIEVVEEADKFKIGLSSALRNEIQQLRTDVDSLGNRGLVYHGDAGANRISFG